MRGRGQFAIVLVMGWTSAGLAAPIGQSSAASSGTGQTRDDPPAASRPASAPTGDAAKARAVLQQALTRYRALE